MKWRTRVKTYVLTIFITYFNAWRGLFRLGVIRNYTEYYFNYRNYACILQSLYVPFYFFFFFNLLCFKVIFYTDREKEVWVSYTRDCRMYRQTSWHADANMNIVEKIIVCEKTWDIWSYRNYKYTVYVVRAGCTMENRSSDTVLIKRRC